MRELYGRSLDGFKLADLHMHTRGSLDVSRRGGLEPHEAVLQAQTFGLSSIAITDHDNISSSLEAQRYSQVNNLAIEVVSGSELTTRDGHLIGIFLHEDIPVELSTEKGLDGKIPRISMKNAIRKIHQQGGLAIIPHPFYKRLDSARKNTLTAIYQSKDPQVYIDGYEVHNQGVIDASSRGGDGHRDSNDDAIRYRLAHKGELGAMIGSSDGHRLTVGRGLTAYRGDLYTSIRNEETRAVVLDREDHARMLRETLEVFGMERVIDNLPMKDRGKAKEFIASVI